ncbi:MAG TPA: monovalent cation/H+ antiporter subunit D, partial [Trueperaceae bacterium]|nr:monovalent cation/H+ antiporter subunit D [Trueperaceae bacterium]
GLSGPIGGQLVDLTPHLPILPIVVPLVLAAVMLLVNERHRQLKAGIGAAATATLVLVSFVLLSIVGAEGAPATIVYRLGDWPAPFGIVLVVDRLSALMLSVTSLLGAAAFLFAVSGWAIVGPRFHSLFLLLLMGLNGAFLTGDLFNLYVFFEILLAASYGLLLHGAGRERVRAGLQYIAINLASSLLFLIGVGLIYAVTGTLNLADIMLRAGSLPAEELGLFKTGLAILSVAFLTKAGVWPLSFWLPRAYPAAPPPVAAIFVVMSKVGAYVLLRVTMLAGAMPSAGILEFMTPWLLYGGLATLLYGIVGILSVDELPRMAAFATLISAGTLVAAIGTGDQRIIAGALYYLIGATLATGAAFLLSELIARLRDIRPPVQAVEPVFGDDYDASLRSEFEGYEVGIAIPAGTAMLGGSFVLCALVLAGLPPLSGFLAKFAIVAGAVADVAAAPAAMWIMAGLVIFSGLAILLSLLRKGIDVFWQSGDDLPAIEVRSLEAVPIAVLIALCVGITVFAAPVMAYLTATSAYLAAPLEYIRGVLGIAP